MIWKQLILPDMPDWYEVSNTGLVRNLRDTKILRKSGLYGPIKPVKIRHDNNRGYLLISIKPYKKPCKNFLIHRLVAIAFLENPENKPQVNHINGIKDDNRVENLEWCTNLENQKHSVETGLRYSIRDRIATTKIKNEEYPAIRKRIDLGESLNSIAKSYQVYQPTIAKFVKKSEKFYGKF